VYLTTVGEASCHLLIVLCARCWVTNFSLSILIWCYYRKYFTPFSNNNNKKRKAKPTSQWHTRNTHITQTGNSRIFLCMVPVNRKRSIWNLSFYLSKFYFASFLLRMSKLLHSSLHLSTWSPSFISCDLYLRCWSLANRAKRCFNFGPLKINGTNSKSVSALIAQSWKNRKELWKYKHHCFILSSLLLCYLLHIIAHERVHLLSIDKKAAHKTEHVPSCVLLLYTHS